MEAGGIYKWATQKARSHETREKYHVFICKEGKRSLFLFINSQNYFGEGFEIKKSDYPFFPKASSFIGCTSVVSYAEQEISKLPKNAYLGRLTKNDMKKLSAHIGKSEVMELRYIKITCAALDAVV